VAHRDEVSAEPLDFEYPPGHQAFIVKLGRPANGGVGPDGDIVAFHRACPHRGCAIGDVDLQRGELGPCPCHMSTFDLASGGLQVFGVASQNLVQVVLEERDSGGIHAVGLVGVPYGEPPRKT
jgi:arsenite oxidase small subunit